MKTTNRFTVIITLILVGSLLSTSCQKNKEESNHRISRYAELVTLIPDPPSAYRSVPLWDWNDHITEEGITF